MGQNFCTSCGARLTPGANFCAGCGTRADAAVHAPPPRQSQAPTPPAQPTPQVHMGERVLSALGGVNMKSGMLKRTTYVIVMTDRRLVFAQQTADMLKQASAQAREDAKQSGKGFFGQWGAQISATMRHAERYLTIPPDQTLLETPGNWQLDRAVLLKVKVKAGQHSDEGTNATPDRLVIKTTGGKHVFEMQTGAGSQAKKAFREAGLM